MNRRAFIAGLSGAAAWPMIASAQQTIGTRRIGVLMGLSMDDPISNSSARALQGALETLGWTALSAPWI